MTEKEVLPPPSKKRRTCTLKQPNYIAPEEKAIVSITPNPEDRKTLTEVKVCLLGSAPLSEARLTPVSQTQPELSIIFLVVFLSLLTFLCCCDNSLFEENRREEKRERREKRKESEGRKNETERTKRKKQGGKTDKKEKKEKEASNAERGERRQAKRARRADKQKGRQDRRKTKTRKRNTHLHHRKLPCNLPAVCR